MNEQLSILDKQSEHIRHERKLIKDRWENGFQKWSDEQANDGYSPYGACGYGSMCDYCENNSYGRPCVRALNAMLRDTGERIDYEEMSYEEVWDGVRE